MTWAAGPQAAQAAIPAGSLILPPLPAGAAFTQRYARQDAATAEDRAYLHCSALRFTLAGQPVQVVCPPRHGAEFLSPEFAAVWDAWLPPSLADDWGTWFSDNKLLQSSLEAQGL
jgi:hypothetical protein